MSLAAPAWLASLGLLVPLVAWYLLRARRPRRVVSSTLLWARVPRAATAATPWQRFRPDTTFWLCALALVLGAAALARPWLPAPTTLADHTIFVVDVSGSMQARDAAGVTRLAEARTLVGEHVDGMRDGQQVSIIAAGPRPEVLIAGATSPGEVDDALARLPIQHGAASLRDAFTLATSLQRAGQSTLTRVVTDTEVPPGAPGLLSAVAIDPVGSPGANLAVTRLQVLPQGQGTSQVFVAVRNHASRPVPARLTLRRNEQDVAVEVLELPPRGDLSRTLEVAGAAGDVVSARVEPTDDTVDALPVDDTAHALLAPSPEVRVTVATPGNLFLTAALEAVEGVELTVLDAVPEALGDADLLVVDRLPAPSASRIPMLLIAPTAWPEGVEAGPAADLPTITAQASHEVVADADLSGVAVARATPVRGPDMDGIVRGPAGNLVAAGRAGPTPVVAFGFALTDSNLPLATAWPTMVANTVSWLTGPPAVTPAVAGDVVAVPIPGGLASVMVAPPDGEPVRVSAASPSIVADRVGLWRVTAGEAMADTSEERVAAAAAALPPALVVQADPGESDVAADPPEPVVVTTDDDAAATTLPGRRFVGGALVPLVGALLLAEWVRTTLRASRRRRTPAGVAS